MDNTPPSSVELALANLLWLCKQPDIVSSAALQARPHVLDETALKSNDLQRNLANHLDALGTHFLGAYVEALWSAYLSSSNRYRVLAQNLQIHHAGKTLGEFDFLVADAEQVIHQELAIKFYLGLPDPDEGEPWWFGPNNIDRLDKKLKHTREHQLRLSEDPSVQALLSAQGIALPNRTESIVRGRLFLPLNTTTRDQLLNREHLTRHVQKDTWCTVSEFSSYLTLHQGDPFWPLQKRQWMCLETQAEPLSGKTLLDYVDDTVTTKQRSILFKHTRKEDGSTSALFVVPDHWEARSYASLRGVSE